MLSPYRGFRDVRSEVEQMFDEVFGGAGRLAGRRASQPGAWAPAMDVLSREGDLVVRAELPGVKLDEVDVTVQSGVLTISGEQGAEKEEERGGFYMKERRRGAFRRSLTLPESVDEDDIRARFEDGVLEVTVAGAAAVREPKRIEIESGEEGEDQ